MGCAYRTSPLQVVETNKLLKKAKQRQGQSMIIHTIPKEEIILATWVDAAHGNRQDVSSTKGALLGCTSRKLLEGTLEPVNPVF